MMQNPVCANVFVPLRMGPSHRSEQGSQILFGEKYSLIERSLNWLKIRNEFDGYEGWMDADHHLYFEAGDGDMAKILSERTVFTDYDGEKISLEAGSEIYNYREEENTFVINGKQYKATGRVNLCPVDESVEQTARRFLNCPYLWGGRTEGGMDCSGLTQLVYKIHGHSLPRDSFKQAEQGKTVSFIEEALEGDLVFFDNERGNITHVGLILEKGYVIHCSGKVRIDRIDHQGIYLEESKRYTHRLRTIKRLINED
ncbi:MAG: NlpC/P60 family protein [Bacteroidota bacterium]